MNDQESLSQFLTAVFKQPILWAIALIAILSDLYAIWSYNPYNTTLPTAILFLTLLSLIAEAGLIFAIIQHLRGIKANFVDAIMTAVSYFIPLLFIKIVPLLLVGIYLILLLFSLNLIMNNPLLFLLSFVISIPLLMIAQIYSFLGAGTLLYYNTSLGESISQAWHTFWDNKGQIVKIALPFLVIDLVHIATLVLTKAVTLESIFNYEVTVEMAERNRDVFGGITEPGIYSSVNRFINAFLAGAFKYRGFELASFPLSLTNKPQAGILASLVGMILLLVRIPIWTRAQVKWMKPRQPLQDNIRTTSSMQ